MSDETWRPLPGWRNYEASNLGRIRSKARGPWRLLTPSRAGNGYLTVSLCQDGRPATKFVHQLVASAFHARQAGQTDVRHLNGDRFDNRFSNLAYGTHAQNGRDTVAHGAHAMAQKTHCPEGHAYTEANTYTSPNPERGPRRECRTCRAARARARRATDVNGKAVAFALQAGVVTA